TLGPLRRRFHPGVLLHTGLGTARSTTPASCPCVLRFHLRHVTSVRVCSCENRTSATAHQSAAWPPTSDFPALSLLRSVRTLMPRSSDALVRLPWQTSSARSISFSSASVTLSDVRTTAPSGIVIVAALADVSPLPDVTAASSLGPMRAGEGPLHAPLK